MMGRCVVIVATLDLHTGDWMPHLHLHADVR